MTFLITLATLTLAMALGNVLGAALIRWLEQRAKREWEGRIR